MSLRSVAEASDRPGARGPRADGVATRAKILTAAERLFARSGVDAVSTRDIVAEAGMNPSAIHYHFGTKQGLVSELLRDRETRLVRRESVYLGRVERSDEPTVAMVADAFFAATAEVSRRRDGQQTIRFLAEIAGHPEYMYLYQELSHEAFRRKVAALGRVMPSLSEAERISRATVICAVVARLLGGPAGGAMIRRHLPSGEPVALTDVVLDAVTSLLSTPR